MKKTLIIFMLMSVCQLAVMGQKKYEMVVKQTDGAETVFNTKDIDRVYFRELNDGNSDTEVVPTIPEELKPFVGLWRITPDGSSNNDTPEYDIYFFQEGSYFDFRKNFMEMGKWSYDSQSKTLTLIGHEKAMWKIVGFADGKWSGLSLWKANNVGYTATLRNDPSAILYAWKTLTQWTCEDFTARFYGAENKCLELGGWTLTSPIEIFRFGDDATRRKVNSYWMDYKYGLPNYTVDEANDAMKMESTYKGPSSHEKVDMKYIQYYEKTCVIEIVHPYSYDHMYMNITMENYGQTRTARFLPSWRKSPIAAKNDKKLLGTWQFQTGVSGSSVKVISTLTVDEEKCSLKTGYGSVVSGSYSAVDGKLLITPDSQNGSKDASKFFTYSYGLDGNSITLLESFTHDPSLSGVYTKK